MSTRKRTQSSQNSEESTKRLKTENESNTEELLLQIENLKSELKAKDEEIKLITQKLESQDQELKLKDRELAQNEKDLRIKDQELILKDEELAQKEKDLRDKDQDLKEALKIVNHEKQQDEWESDFEDSNYFKTDEKPEDEISIWMCNSGLSFLARKMLGFVDIKSLANCKKVSKTWYNFIENDKMLLILQTQQIMHLPIEMRNQKTHEIFTSTVWETYIDEDQKSDWKRVFQLMEFESIDVIKDMFAHLQRTFKDARSGVWLSSDVKFCCLTWKMLQTFETLLKEFKMTSNDILSLESYLYFYKLDKINLECLKMTLEGMKQCHYFNINKVPFRVYEIYRDDKCSWEEKVTGHLMELLLQNAEEFGIDFTSTNKFGKTLKDQAKFDKVPMVLALLEKYKIEK